MNSIIVGGISLYVLFRLFKYSKKRNSNASKTKESESINFNDHYKSIIERYKKINTSKRD